MAISAEQAAQLASAYQSGNAGLQGLVSQMGVTQADVEKYFPGFDVGAAGLTVAPTPAYGTDGFSAEDVKGYVSANINDPGAIARQMQRTGVTQQDLESIYQGTYSPEQITSYLSSPKATLYGPGQVTGQEFVNYAGKYLGDPTRTTQFAKSLGLGAEDIYGLSQLYTPQMGLTQQGIQDYLGTGEQDFANRYAQLAQDVFGSSEEIDTLANAVYNQNRRRIANDPNLTPAQKRQALEQTRDDFIAQTYGAESFADTSLEDIEKTLRESGANRLQEAYRLGNIAMDVLGYSQEDAQQVVNKAMSGQELTAPEQNIFDTLLQQENLTSKNRNDLLTYAAVTNPEAPIFQRNPELLELYTPLSGVIEKTSDSKWGGGSGQYGYYNGAPVLNAEIAQNIVGEHGSTTNLNSGGNNYSDIAKTLGIDFASHAETTAWKAGRSIVGVDFDKEYLENLADFDAAERRGEIIPQIDHENGGIRYTRAVANPRFGLNDEPEYIYETVNAPARPESTMYSGIAKVPTSMQEAQNQILSAAQKLGIDTKNKDIYELFDEVSDRTAGMYQLVGNSSAIDKDTNKEGKNHINALYQQVGNKLVLQDANFFHADAPKKKSFGPIGGFVGDMLSGIASIPFVAELSLLNPATAGWYPVIKGVQVAGLTNDFEKGLAAGGKAWLMQQGASLANEAIGNALIDFGLTDINTVNALSEIGANVATNMGIAAIDGESLSDAGIQSLIASTLASGAKGAVDMAGIPPQYQAAVTQILADAILQNDLDKSLSRIAMKEVFKGAKDLAKETTRERQAA